jgi:hypothetical protein
LHLPAKRNVASRGSVTTAPVFSALNARWRKIVNTASENFVPIAALMNVSVPAKRLLSMATEDASNVPAERIPFIVREARNSCAASSFTKNN